MLDTNTKEKMKMTLGPNNEESKIDKSGNYYMYCNFVITFLVQNWSDLIVNEFNSTIGSKIWLIIVLYVKIIPCIILKY